MKTAEIILNNIKDGKMTKAVGTELLKSLKSETTIKDEDIAIIGMAVQLPGAENIEQFWNNIKNGKDTTGMFPKNRKDDIEPFLDRVFSHTKNIEYLKGGYLEEIDKFDYKFFRLTRKEAKLMDPNQRIFLETAWQAIDDAGYAKQALSGSRTGVYLGFSPMPIYKQFISEEDTSSEKISITGNVSSIVASRIAYLLDLKGPSMVIDTACSSSLVALHEACVGINNNDCDQALVGGIKLTLLPMKGKIDIGIESNDNYTRTFDKDANGTLWGEGSVAIFIKPLKRAVLDNDHIYGVIKGSAINQDGGSVGITAPNVLSQTDVLIKAWEKAKINSETLSYIETHGTGTVLGDPIEIDGITNAFRKYTMKKQFCAVGSLKPNIGHLDTASGLASVVKAVLAMQHKEIPPSLYFNQPNKSIDFIQSPVYVNHSLRHWEKRDTPRRCGISAFGFSGTNCHVVLEEFKKTYDKEQNLKGPMILTLSAKTEKSLKKYLEKYSVWISKVTEVELNNLCYTSNLKNNFYPVRIAFVIEDFEDLKNKLEIVQQEELDTLVDNSIFYNNLIQKSESVEAQGQIFNVQEAIETYQTSNNEEARENSLRVIADAFVNGCTIDWKVLYSYDTRIKVKVPEYPLERTRCWLNYPIQDRVVPKNIEITTDYVNGILGGDKMIELETEQRKSKLRNSLIELFMETLEMEHNEIGLDMNFFEMGLDSIILVEITQKILDKYNIEIPIGNFFDKISTINELTDYMMNIIPEEVEMSEIDKVPFNENVPSSTMDYSWEEQTSSVEQNDLIRIVEKQLDIMNQGLKLLGMKHQITPNLVKSSNQIDSNYNEESNSIKKAIVSDEVYVPYKKLELYSTNEMTDIQQNFLEDLISRLNEKNCITKDQTQRYRTYLANNRNVAGFKPLWKEMIYQLIVNRAKGSKIFDMDNNEYIDLTMGFGACLFGHNEQFIVEAIEKELNQGTSIGPMSHLAGDVASLVCELTHSERAAFFNSGTEAVMVALRLARAATGRSKFVIFVGSYHGTFDGILARRHNDSKECKSVPLVPRGSQNYVNDVYVLDYGTDESLNFIREHSHELSAVLVEPVQSRRPDFQPKEYLEELRKITKNSGIALIFDEVITGFRICTGGCKEWFNVEADLTTYGKIAGGTMPIGIVAGKSYYMDGIDGGTWSYGDFSIPPNENRRTFVAGTFCHHPLAMAASKAVLSKLKEEGNIIQEILNKKTKNLCETLNEFFTINKIPIKMVYFGSLFRFVLKGDLEILFYLLLDKGIYVWEGRNCFISVAHTDEDIKKIIKNVEEAVIELCENGFIKNTLIISKSEKKKQLDNKIDITEEQKQLWFTAKLSPEASAAFNQSTIIKLKGVPNVTNLREALKEIVARHDGLRIVFAADGNKQIIKSTIQITLREEDFTIIEENKEEYFKEWLLKEEQNPFDFEEGPLMRAILVKQDENEYAFVFIIHHLIADGWSIEILFNELCTIYNAKCENREYKLRVASSIQNYIKWNQELTNSRSKAEAYWSEVLKSNIESLLLPTDYIRPAKKTYNGSRESMIIDEYLYTQIISVSSELNCTTYMILLSAFYSLIYRITSEKNILVGIPMAGQAALKEKNLIGQCVNILPIVSTINHDYAFKEFVGEVKKALLEAYENKDISFSQLAKKQANSICSYEINVIFNMDRHLNIPKFKDMEPTIMQFPIHYVQNDLMVNIVESEGKLLVDFDYNTDLFNQNTITCWMHYFINLLKQELKSLTSPISTLPLMSFEEENKLFDLWNNE